VQAVGLRDEIALSWDRCRVAGLQPDHFDVPYTGEVDGEGSLARAARGVIDRLAAHLSGETLSIILTDAQGRVLDRRAEDRSLLRSLDRISLAPGFSYSEPVAGTNAIGMALRDERSVVVLGGEHYAEVLQPMACYATPVRNPLTQQIEGVLDLTCSRTQANGLALALVMQAGREIESNLFQGTTASDPVLPQASLVGVPERRTLVGLADRSVQVTTFVEELTARELDVLDLIVAGHANKQIAQRLHISEKTVKTHVSNVFGKLGVQSRTQAAMRAINAGVVQL
jgi:transcriptional regulator of acetoin/glycerol metabolism